MDQHQPADVSAVRNAHDTVTGALARWAPGRDVVVGESDGTHAIVVTPLALLCDDALRSTRASSVGLRVRYAVSVPIDDHDGLEVLERLVAAAATRADLAVLDDGATASWYDRGVPRGRVGCIVDVLARHHHRPEPTTTVRQPLEVRLQPLATVAGRVVTTGGDPLPGVRVTAGHGGATTLTDHDGRFRVPAIGPAPTLWVEIQGHHGFPVDSAEAGGDHLEVVVDDG